MAIGTKAEPLLKAVSIRVQSVEVLKIVVGEQKVWYTSRFASVVIGGMFVVSVIKIEVGPNLDRELSVAFASLVIAVFQLSVCPCLDNHFFWCDEP